MIKTVKEYFDERAQFFAQHKYDYNMTTSPMDEYGMLKPANSIF